MADTRTFGLLDDGGDLPCMRCGYNLRGLSGDPRRCPECGYPNPLQELLLPAGQIRRQLRRLESAPTWCFAAVLLIGVGVAQIVGFQSNRQMGGVRAFGAVCALCGSIIWPLSARSFAQSCMHRAGWKRALWNFHLYAVVIFIAGHAAALGTCFVPIASITGFLGFRIEPVAIGVTVIATWVVAVVVIRRLYRRLRAELAPLQRATAVEMYVRQRARWE